MIDVVLREQKKFFESGATLSPGFRVNKLKELYAAIRKYEKEIAFALGEDLGKGMYESYMCEIGMALSEIRYLIKHTRSWMKEKRVRTPLAQFSAKSYSKPTPYGNTLIMSPWNYPFLLTIDPLAAAVAAGNTAIVKPSAYAPATADVLEKILAEVFPKEYISVIKGGRNENSLLLKQKFDFVFFTGSQNVGKEVLRHMAENLTPVVLELGGKSPCIVDRSAKLELVARRIVFGKFLNCGQTCVAPDYILCESAIKDKLLEEIKRQIMLQYGENPLSAKDYGHIINKKHFDRLLELIVPEKVVYGGEYDRESLKIAPTVMDRVSWEDAVMQQEIFGPVLPVLTFDSFDDVFFMLSEREKPLALYLFTEDKAHMDAVTERISFGGGCINDVIIHLATSEMGFGGVGESGMGSYHGKAGFDAFTHYKSIVNKKTWIDLPMRYRPYKGGIYEKLLRRFLK